MSKVINGGGNLLNPVRCVLALVWLSLLGAWLSGGQSLLIVPAMTILLLTAAGLQIASGRVGDLVAAACRWANRKGWWRLTARIVKGVLAAAVRPGTRTGVGFQVMAGPPWADEYYRGRSVEVFFDATTPAYLDVITDDLLPVIESAARAGTAVAGWFSLRFMGRSEAVLAMQRWDRTVSVEVAVLRGIPGSLEVLRRLEAVAVAHNGLVHWGQQHDLDIRAVERAYPALPEWRKQLRSLSHGSEEGVTFENDYCKTRGLTP